jgi:hypothetical protein
MISTVDGNLDSVRDGYFGLLLVVTILDAVHSGTVHAGAKQFNSMLQYSARRSIRFHEPITTRNSCIVYSIGDITMYSSTTLLARLHRP